LRRKKRRINTCNVKNRLLKVKIKLELEFFKRKRRKEKEGAVS
jgi:hypothetical protein